MRAKRLTELALLMAVALIIVVVELRKPNPIPIPGAFTGLSAQMIIRRLKKGEIEHT